jgi:hypothetical protein
LFDISAHLCGGDGSRSARRTAANIVGFYFASRAGRGWRKLKGKDFTLY